MSPSRRTVLKRGTAALLAGSVTGCLGDGSDGTDTPARSGSMPTASATPASTATDTATATDSDTATPTSDGSFANDDYTTWLPSPAILGTDRYLFVSVTPRTLVEMKDSLGEGAVSDFENEVDFPGIGTYADVDAFHVARKFGRIVEADVATEEAVAVLEEHGLSEVESRHGFTVYAGEGGAAAVSPDAAVWTTEYDSDTTARRRVESVVDARAGAVPRYHEEVPNGGRLVDELGSGHYIVGKTHPPGITFDGAVAGGIVIRVDTEETRVEAPVVFQEGQARKAPVLEWGTSTNVFHGREPNVTIDGNVVTAAATVPSDDVDWLYTSLPGKPEEPDPDPPKASFGYDYEATGDGVGVLTIRHEGGDAVEPDELFLRGTGFAEVDGVDQTGAGPWQGTVSGEDDRVASGDAVAVGASSDYEIRIVWESADSEASATLNEDEGPDA